MKGHIFLIFIISLLLLVSCSEKDYSVEQQTIKSSASSLSEVDYVVKNLPDGKQISITAELDGYFLEDIADLASAQTLCLIRVREETFSKQAYAYDLQRDEFNAFVFLEDLDKKPEERRSPLPEKDDLIYPDTFCNAFIETS